MVSNGSNRPSIPLFLFLRRRGPEAGAAEVAALGRLVVGLALSPVVVGGVVFDDALPAAKVAIGALSCATTARVRVGDGAQPIGNRLLHVGQLPHDVSRQA